MTSARRHLVPFAALSASYFAHIGFFNPYLPLWLKDQGYSLLVISLLTAVPAVTRLIGPYAWGALSDHTGERVKLLRYAATTALIVPDVPAHQRDDAHERGGHGASGQWGRGF